MNMNTPAFVQLPMQLGWSPKSHYGTSETAGALVAICPCTIAQFIKWNGWTLAMALPWWQHHEHCLGYYYIIIINCIYHTDSVKHSQAYILSRPLTSHSCYWPAAGLQHWALDLQWCHAKVSRANVIAVV